jgi:magnesium-transporting ATPase (P-type)
MYSLYNITYTSFPIMWFAMADWEYTKDELLNNPKLYKIGLQDIYFNKWVFWRWFFTGIWQGILLIMVVTRSIDSNFGYKGQGGSLDLDGMCIFTIVVLIVNLKVMISSSDWNFFMYFWVIGQSAFYLVCFWFLSYIPDYYLFGVFNHMFNFPTTYFVVVFFVSSFLIIETGLQQINNEIRVQR